MFRGWWGCVVSDLFPTPPGPQKENRRNRHPEAPREIAFALPFALDSLNKRLRQHWSARVGSDRNLAQEIMVALGGPRHYPRPPFNRARITIVRCGIQLLDPDGLPAAQKPLIDTLCVASTRHPVGLGIIVDDSARHIELVVTQQRGEAPWTMVRVVELPDPAPEPVAKSRRVYRGPKRATQAQIAAGNRGHALQSRKS